MVECNSTSSVHQYKSGKYFLNVAGGNGGTQFHIKSTLHQYKTCKYKINSAGPNCGTQCQCVWSIGGQRQHYSTKSKQQSIEKCILNVALYECMQRRCYPVWNCVPRRITTGTSFGADELQRIIKK